MPESNQDVATTAAEIVEQTALDAIIRRFEAIVVALEQKRAEAEKLPAVPDDVPRFVTRYSR